MDVTVEFFLMFLRGLRFTSPLLLLQLLTIILFGLFVGRFEGWSKFDALYWAFITAFTVGYGDFRPTKPLSKALSILIAFTGVLFAGIVVAVALHAAQHAFKAYI